MSRRKRHERTTMALTEAETALVKLIRTARDGALDLDVWISNRIGDCWTCSWGVTRLGDRERPVDVLPVGEAADFEAAYQRMRENHIRDINK